MPNGLDKIRFNVFYLLLDTVYSDLVEFGPCLQIDR